jgi:RNA polymerase sigma-70 factor, ECF subfamily
MAPLPEGPLEPLDFDRLIAEYADRVYSVALRITGSSADAEDVLQETFLRAFEQQSSFRGEAAWATWLYRIAVNTSLQLLRARRPSEPLEDTAGEVVHVGDWAQDVARQVELGELRDVLEQGLTRLPTEYRAAVVLRDVEGLTTAEVAQVLQISEAAVKSRLHRGRVLLRQYLADFFEGP